MTDMDEGDGETFVSTGEQLKRAREAKGLALEDVASQTRIPIRHLQAIEREDWDALPAPTYAVGFARNYANAVGLDGAAVGLELRERLGGALRSRAPVPEYYEPADPSRMPPTWLIAGALLFAALLIAGYFFWFSSYRSEQVPELEVPAEAPQAAPAQPAAPQATANGPVTLTARRGLASSHRRARGERRLFSGSLKDGPDLQVPATPPPRRPLIAPADRNCSAIGRRPRFRPARARGASDQRRQPAAPGPSPLAPARSAPSQAPVALPGLRRTPPLRCPRPLCRNVA